MNKLYFYLFAVMFAVVFGCAEMPELADEIRSSKPQLAGSAYTILEAVDAPQILYFRSDAPCVSGIKSAGASGKVKRYGRRTTAHNIDLADLPDVHFNQDYTLLLDEVNAAKLRYDLPAINQRTVIGFLGGGRDRNEQLTAASEILFSYRPHTVVLTGNSFPLDKQVKSWDQFFFKPIRNLATHTPLIFLPEDREVMPAEVGAPLKRKFWGRDLGCVRLLFLSMDALKTPSTRQEALTWLQDDLRSTQQTWRVLCLSTPIFGAQNIHARAVETLGTLLETGGVDLVISGGENYYLRTLPIKSANGKPVRYVVTGGLDAEQQKGLGREYTSALFNEAHIGILTATPEQLDWHVYPLDPNNKRMTLDNISIAVNDSGSGEPIIEKLDILTDALSALALQREVLIIARQAAKAVPNLRADKQTYNFVMHNVTTREIRGTLAWKVASETAWKVTPSAIEFLIQPGFSGNAQFNLDRYITVESAPMPELAVNMQHVGSATQPLIMTQKKAKEIFHRLDMINDVIIDGALTENDWTRAAVIADFVVLDGELPRQHLEARVMYDQRGLYFLIRAAAKHPAAIATSATKRDEQVHRDESVEFFFDPQGLGRDFYQLAINTQGVKLDRSSQFGLAWNPQWEAKVSLHNDYYVVEAFVPFTSFGLAQPPAPGSRWGFNLVRNDFSAGGERVSANKTISLSDDNTVKTENIEDTARKDLGEKATAPKTPTNAPKYEIVQWADTFGSNARSSCYGDFIFRAAGK